MSADQFSITGEGHVALERARTHARAGEIGRSRVFWKLQRCTTMANREARRSERPYTASLKLGAKRTLAELIQQVEGSWT
jgi:hypothetical protein